MLIILAVDSSYNYFSNFFYIHGSVHRESNLITIQQDVTCSNSTKRADGNRSG